jgi:3-isopropylmalate/(R)-2-methylmalate dehydratase large subunit
LVNNLKPQTITQKILARHCGKNYVEVGEIVNAQVDVILGNDITMPLAIKEFNKLGLSRVFDKEKVIIVLDHFTPNKDIKSAQQCKFIREFANSYEIKNYFETGRMGIEHALLPELGLVMPGELIVGADSHTCTYGALGALSTGVGSTDVAAAMASGNLWFMVPDSIKFTYNGNLRGVGSTDVAAAMASGNLWFMVPDSIKFTYNGNLRPWVTGKDLILYTIGMIGVDGAIYKSMEFSGPVIEKLSIDSRFTMCNMAIEAGGKFGIIEFDDITKEYVDKRNKKDYKIFKSDQDVKYFNTYEINCSNIDLQVAAPHLPSNTHNAKDLDDILIDQVVIGSCTNGRLEDLKIASDIMKGRKVDSKVRVIIIPATQKIYLDALEKVKIFIESGCAVSTPTCGPCLGGHMGVLADGEKAVSTTNRNFVGRMGHPESEVYLSGPAVAAASAILGRIATPEEVM